MSWNEQMMSIRICTFCSVAASDEPNYSFAASTSNFPASTLGIITFVASSADAPGQRRGLPLMS
jgi:hypothetical protein